VCVCGGGSYCLAMKCARHCWTRSAGGLGAFEDANDQEAEDGDRGGCWFVWFEGGRWLGYLGGGGVEKGKGRESSDTAGHTHAKAGQLTAARRPEAKVHVALHIDNVGSAQHLDQSQLGEWIPTWMGVRLVVEVCRLCGGG
jgi:hypothetical protein